MKKTLPAITLTIALIMLLLPQLAAADACKACVERKKPLCSSECELVASDRNLECQRDCSLQYCAHRCNAEDPAFKTYEDYGCAGCLDQQFDLCQTSCKTGSTRVRAQCQLQCSDLRCKGKCLANVEQTKPPAIIRETEESGRQNL